MNLRFFSLLLAAMALTLLPSCMDPPPGSESSIWQRPPRYGAGGTDSPRPGNNNPSTQQAPQPPEEGSGGGRFGYSGDAEEGPEVTGGEDPLAPGDDQEDPVAADRPAEDPPEKKGGPPSVSEMPFAKGVPGKPLEVTLPAPYDKLGAVSIEQYEGGKPTGKPLPPGTPVEIPDPGNPGKKIYFKVP